MNKDIEKRRIIQPQTWRKVKRSPGTTPRWASGAKTLVGTATSPRSRIWFTINNGALAEVHHPDVNQANARSIRFLVTGPDRFFSDEIWNADHRVEWMKSGVPGCRIRTQCKQGRYTIAKEIITDTLLLRMIFTPADGLDLRLCMSMDPHVGIRARTIMSGRAPIKVHPCCLPAVSRSFLLSPANRPCWKRFPAGFVASLSLPWGFERTNEDVGGYHVVWPRNLVEIAMGKLASGDARAARSTLFYLGCMPKEDGGWSQNMWLDGTPNLGAIQMNGIALPVLLADKLRRDNALDGFDPKPMVHAATQFVLQHGPVTQQDRWETTSGYSPYTMAVEVAALLAGADCADERGGSDEAQFLRETADAWNDSIDELTYVRDTALAKQHGVKGYYLRMTPLEYVELRQTGKLKILLPNQPLGCKHQKAVEIVSPDALALVRFGLRAADDPRMLDTVKVIDATLRRETRTGPTWTRATRDGYGEKPDGTAFKKSGVGRGWPLLSGERGHYAIAAGRREQALEFLNTMARQASECGMLPEQVWDEQDVPSRQLYNGRPTGSSMPLAWVHEEYIKLLRSLQAKEIWDAVPQITGRYVRSHHPASFQIWRPKQRRAFVTAGKNLRIDLPGPARILWRQDRRQYATPTSDSGLGLHTVTFSLATLGTGRVVRVAIEPVRRATESTAHQSAKADAFLIRIRSGNGDCE